MAEEGKMETDQQKNGIWTNQKAMLLVTEMMAGRIVDIRPQVDFTSELGFNYPSVEKALDIKGDELLEVLQSLTEADILREKFFDRLLRCPQCRSINLRPTTHCPKCGSGYIARGRVLEHSACKYAGLEEEFISKGRYICPKCHQEMRTSGVDYQSLGLLYKCHDCHETFRLPLIKWQCLKCATVTDEDKVTELNIYYYSFNEDKRSWLEFELRPKIQLIEFLRQRGYKVAEKAAIKGRSGAEHEIDILATRDDGIIDYTIAIGVKVAGDKIELGEIFDFDDKAYDVGIHDKVLVVVPELGREAEKFASQQRIKVLEVRDLDTVLIGNIATPPKEVKLEPFKFESKKQLIDYLMRHGYDVKENAIVKGKSGADHNIGILATKDDGIIIHHIAIGVLESEQPVDLATVFEFDDKAYDIGIMDKVLIATPGLTPEARQFAKRQKIRLFEIEAPEPSGN